MVTDLFQCAFSRVARANGADAWVPLHQVMNLASHESHLETNARPRLVPAAPAIRAAG